MAQRDPTRRLKDHQKRERKRVKSLWLVEAPFKRYFMMAFEVAKIGIEIHLTPCS